MEGYLGITSLLGPFTNIDQHDYKHTLNVNCYKYIMLPFRMISDMILNNPEDGDHNIGHE